MKTCQQNIKFFFNNKIIEVLILSFKNINYNIKF